jgi:hypothetical protein
MHTGGIAFTARNDSSDATVVYNNGGAGPIIKAFNGGALRMQLSSNGNLMIGGTLTQNSDERLKQEIESVGSALDDVLLLKPATYRFKNAGDESHRLYGFIAQEVRQVLPDIVHENEETGYLSLSYADFSVLAIRAIQEQQEIIEVQAAELAHIGVQVAALLKAAEHSRETEIRLARLESLLGAEEFTAK